MQANIIAHYQSGSSDKIYIMSVRRKSDGNYEVVAKWGRRGRERLASQLKATTSNRNEAFVIQCKLMDEKLKKGYVDIRNPFYKGSVRANSPDIVPNLEPELEDGKPLPEVFKDEWKDEWIESNRMIKGETELVCKDNTGMEDGFDRGVSYICEPNPNVKNMFYAYDKFGKKREVFAERFRKATA